MNDGTADRGRVAPPAFRSIRRLPVECARGECSRRETSGPTNRAEACDSASCWMTAEGKRRRNAAGERARWIDEVRDALELLRARIHQPSAHASDRGDRARMVEDIVAIDAACDDVEAALERIGRVFAREIQRGVRSVDLSLVRALRGAPTASRASATTRSR